MASRRQVRVSSASTLPEVWISTSRSSLDHVTDCTASPRGSEMVRNSTMLPPRTYNRRTLADPPAVTAIIPVVGAAARMAGPPCTGAHAASNAAATAAKRWRKFVMASEMERMTSTVPNTFHDRDVHFAHVATDCYGRRTVPPMLNLQLRAAPGTAL